MSVIGDLPLASRSNTAVLSFSRAGAAELTSRLGKDAEEFGFVGTIHALCFKALSLTRGQVATVEKFKAHIGNYEEASLYTMQDVELALSIGGLVARTGRSMAEVFDMFPTLATAVTDEYFDFMWRWYGNWKSAYFLADFDDMLARANPGPFDIVIIDEAQDLSPLQWDLVDRLVADKGQLILAGDDDQSIYTWAGADSQGMMKAGGTVHILEQSYRVPRAILPLAISTVSQIKNRQSKRYEPRDYEGRLSATGEMLIADDGIYDCLVLCRDRWTMQGIEEEYIQLGRPYHKEGAHGQGLFDGWLGRLWRETTKEEPDAEFILTQFGRRLTPRGRELLEEQGMKAWDPDICIDATPEHLSYIDRAHRTRRSVRMPTLSTIHAQKGKEADHVMLMADTSGVVDELQYTELAFEDEVRVWYTAITRAKESLTIVGQNAYIRH